MSTARLAILTILLAILVSGCETIKAEKVSPDLAKPVPSERILSKNASTELAKVAVVRDFGFLGGGCYLAIMIDGELAARIDKGEVAIFYLSAGEHTLAVGADPRGEGLCTPSIFGWYSPVIKTYQIKGETTNYFRISLAFHRRPVIIPLN